MLAPLSARADQTTVGVQLAGTHGTHRESDGTATAPLIPAPLLTASHSAQCWEVAAEGLPPIGPIPVGDNALGMQNVALTYADAVARYWNQSHTFAVGIGDTLYNQRTEFAREISPTVRGTEVDSSRVVGTRYELTFRKALSLTNGLEARVAVDPAMHGRFSYTQTEQNGVVTFGPYTSPPSWERASQVDADAHFIHRFGTYAVLYGVRYLNYTASYTDPFQPRFADANSLIMPYVALQRYWGENGSVSCPSVARFAAAQFFLGGEGFTAGHSDVYGSAGGATTVLPTAAASLRHGQYELAAESTLPATPMSGTLRFRGSSHDVTDGFTDAALRYWLRGGRAAVGVGDSIYVSRAYFPQSVRGHVLGQFNSGVRAAGTRYELLDAFPLARNSRLVLDLAASPKMHERRTAWVDGIHGTFSPAFGTGSLVDASLRVEVPRGAGHTWVYGVRDRVYSGRPDYGSAYDRTSGLAFFTTWGFTINP